MKITVYQVGALFKRNNHYFDNYFEPGLENNTPPEGGVLV
jgi:hypothetical protein